MDPLIVTASVITILQLTNKVIQYLSDVEDAPKECQQCAREVSNLLCLLIDLRYSAEQAQVGDPWFEQLRKLNVKDGPLDQYKRALGGESDEFILLDSNDHVNDVERFNRSKKSTVDAT
jgi:hypothetical protein